MSKEIRSVLKIGDGYDPQCFSTSALVSIWNEMEPANLVIRDHSAKYSFLDSPPCIVLRLTEEQADTMKGFLHHLREG